VTTHPDDVQLSRLIDGDLSLATREAVLSHLRRCPACCRRHDELVSVAATMRQRAPLAWTAIETDAVLDRLSRRRHRGRVVVAGLVSLIMCAAVAVEAAPVAAVVLALLGVLVGVTGALTPTGMTAGATQLVAVIAAVAILAPLAAYPLARWR